MFGLPEYWERMVPRERRLVSLLGVVALVCVFAVIGIQIKRGLRRLEDENAQTREALTRLDEYSSRQSVVKTPAEIAADSIGETAPALGSYLEQMSKQADVNIREATDRADAPPKGGFIEKSVDIKLSGVTIDQLTKFLKAVEGGAPGVVTQRIWVRPYTGQRDKLEVELTISAFERVKKVPAGTAAPVPDKDKKEGT